MTVPLSAGAYVLGVRVNRSELGAMVRELFRDRLIEGVEPPANLSLFLAASESADGVQELHRFYVNYSRALRSRSAVRALRALWHELDLRDVEAARERLQLDATVLVRDGHAYVLPARSRKQVVDAERRWRREGFLLVDRRRVDLDPVAGTVSVPPTPLEGGADRLRGQLAHLRIEDVEEPIAASGIYPIAAWVLQPGDRTLAMRVIEAAAQVVDRPAHDGVALIEGLAELLERTPDVASDSSDALREQLRDL